MQYLNDLVGTQLNIESDDKIPLWRMIKQSEVTQFLKQRGYTIATFTPEIIDKKTRSAYISLKPGFTLNRFQNALINTTPIPAVLNVLETSNQFGLHRKKILYTLNHLVDLAKQNHPLFVFAHVEAPHPPFVFGPNGEKRNPEEKFDDHDGNWLIRKGRLTRDQYLQGYIDQLIYVNNKITSAIEGILAQSQYPPIIIIFGDHGPRSTLVWHNPDNTYMKECMSILNAYYLPNGGDVDLYDDITPVNTFRIILNRYFGANYEILEDESYFSTAQYCYKFINVTDRIKNSNNEILHNHLGKSLLNEGDLDKAIHHYSEALRINSDSADPHINLALIYAKKNQNTKAVFHFKKAIQFKPKNHALHNDLGVAYLKLSQPQEAIPPFQEAIKNKPDFVQAYLNLGDALAQQGRFGEAIDNYTAALQIQPDYADTHNKLGVAYARQGRLEEAIVSFSEALRIKPDDVRAQNNLRIALQQAGRAGEAALLETRP
jgi:tetratricopeptide (TPR) repeat protein